MFADFVENAIARGNTDFHYGEKRNAQSQLIEFNTRIEELIVAHDKETIGNAIWHIYGCCSNTTHDALDLSVDDGVVAFYASLKNLYECGFARYCISQRGHSDRTGGNFATACYMLWDMDSGLNYHTLRGRPTLFPFAESLIDYGLMHTHAACQESFLHCLGHMHYDKASFVDTKITGFLRRRDIDPAIRQYAKACRTGMMM